MNASIQESPAHLWNKRYNVVSFYRYNAYWRIRQHHMRRLIVPDRSEQHYSIVSRNTPGWIHDSFDYSKTRPKAHFSLEEHHFYFSCWRLQQCRPLVWLSFTFSAATSFRVFACGLLQVGTSWFCQNIPKWFNICIPQSHPLLVSVFVGRWFHTYWCYLHIQYWQWPHSLYPSVCTFQMPKLPPWRKNSARSLL